MRIALVEGNPALRVSIGHLLTSRGDDVLAFANPSDALVRVRSDAKIDALVIDADSEAFSGVDFCQEARKVVGKQRALYVLLMLSSGQRSQRVEALNCGADDVIDPPPPSDELLAKLKVAERIVAFQRAATMDYLTGVYNRGAFFGEAKEACRGGTLAAILLDIDHLKEINDRYGHNVGDAAIRAVAAAVQSEAKIVGRLGGDEFCILLKGRGLTEALNVSADVQQRLAEVKLTTPGEEISVTCSLGVAERQSEDDIDDLIKRADLALYRAKEEGRNRIASEPIEPSLTACSRLRVTRSRLPRPSLEVRERRSGGPTSEGLLARVCALVDMLVASGLDTELATHVMAQKLMVAGIPAPRSLEGRNWWQSIHAWRAAARNGISSAEALQEYQNIVAALESVPPQDRVTSALDNELWNRRRLVLRPLKSGQDTSKELQSELPK